jgi:hypothetical protein
MSLELVEVIIEGKQANYKLLDLYPETESAPFQSRPG